MRPFFCFVVLIVLCFVATVYSTSRNLKNPEEVVIREAEEDMKMYQIFRIYSYDVVLNALKLSTNELRKQTGFQP